MKKVSLLQIGVSTLCLFFVLATSAQDSKKDKGTTNKKEKKGKNWSKKIWGDYDSNSIAKNLAITEAYVTHQEQLQENVIVNVLLNGEIFMADTTDKDGGFGFELKFDHRYTLVFHKNGFVSKSVEIDLTSMTDEAKKQGYDLGRFNMGMLKYVAGMDVEEYKVPVARYFYSDVNKQIQLDRSYFKKRKQLLEVVQERNEKVIAGADADANALTEEYNILIRDADIEFAAKDYKLAKEYYQEAIKIKSLEEYPRGQLKKIEVLLAQELSSDEKYNALLDQGNEAFAAQDYNAALVAYKNAIKIKTTEEYPRTQIQKIESLQKADKTPVAVNSKKKYSLANVQIHTENKGLSNELAKKYPQGLTEEKYTEGSKTIVKRVIVEGDIGVEYKKVTHNWGGVYYFKNGKPVNHFVWQKEAIQ